jgi:hypothetical protein
MRKFSCFLIVAIILVLIKPLHAQEKDFGLHLETELSKKISRKIELQLSEEVRFNQNLTAFDRALTTFSGSYSLNKTFKAGAFYTWIYANNQEDGYYEHRHRFGGWLQADQKVNRFKFTLREKFQNTYRDEDLGNYKYNPKMYLRSRLELSYDIRQCKVEPYCSAEMFYQLNNPYGNGIDKFRYTLGADYSFSKKFVLSPFIRLDQEINVKTPLNETVVGLKAKFKW